jgi:hypothetical protein
MNIKKLIHEEIEEFDLRPLFEEDEFDPLGHINKPENKEESLDWVSKLEIKDEDCILGMSKNNAKLDWPFFSLPAGYTCPFAKGCKTFAAKWKGTSREGEWVKPDSWEHNYKMGPEAEYLCYAARAQAQYPSANISAFNNLNLLKEFKNDVEGMSNLILRSLKYHGFDNTDLFRVHEAGDFFSQTYFDAWMEVARKQPGTLFYAYTVSLPYWITRKGSIPRNFKLIASWDDSNKDVIEREGLRYARVVSGVEEARELGLRIDVDDMLAWGTDESFALPLHGSQPKGTEAAEIRKQQKKKDDSGQSFDDKIKSGKKMNQSYKDELRTNIRRTLRNETLDLYGKSTINEANEWGGTGRDLEMRGHRGYGKDVYVHRNLNAPPYFSIKQTGGATGGKVIGYDTSIHLKDVKFIVGERGNKEVLPKEFGGEGKAKNVHAGAVGKHVSSGQNYDVDGWELVRYNPRDGHKNFIIASTEEPIHSAKEAILMNGKEVWVKL